MSLNRLVYLLLVLASCKDDAGGGATATGVDTPASDAGDAASCNTPEAEKPSYAGSTTAGGVGAWVNLYVTNADPSRADVAVFFVGNVPAPIKGYDPAEKTLTIVVPPDALTGPLTLRVGCAEYVGPAPFIVYDVPAPVITGVSRATVASGELFDVTGTYFTNVNGVTIGDASQAFFVIDDTTIRVQMRLDAPSSGALAMQSPSGLAKSDVMVNVSP